jgi:hypothetical protein
VKPAMDSTHNGYSDLHQMELPFTRVELDKTLTLAPNPKRVNDYWVTQSNASNELVEFMADQFKRSRFFSGKRFRRATYTPVISSILANLLNAHTHKLQIIYSRDTNFGNKAWINVWDFLADLNMVSAVIAGKNENGVQSWCVALPELVELLRKDYSRIIFDRDQPSIEVRDKDKKVLPVSKHRATKLKYNRLEKVTRAFNEYWQAHIVTLDDKAIVPFVKRKFNHTLELGGRFYGGFQLIPSKDRARLKIDKASTIELDYSSIHLAILYAWEGVQLDYPKAYTMKGYERDTIKAITLRALNTKSLAALQGAITRSAKPKNKATLKAYKDSRAIHDLRRAKGLASKPPYKPKWLDTFIEGIPDGTIAKDLMGAFLEKHSVIKTHIGSPNIGLKLQAVDSEIMALVLDTLRLENIPALPVHDSIIIPYKLKKKARAVMAESFKKVTHFAAKIKAV